MKHLLLHNRLRCWAHQHPYRAMMAWAVFVELVLFAVLLTGQNLI